MKLAIMQPYFFPYLGYWQMFAAVDKFVLLDDVNYIMRGFINRNSILLNGKPHRFVIPLEKPSQNKLIKDTKLSFSYKDRDVFLKTIVAAYGKAPCFCDFYPVLSRIIFYKGSQLAEFLKNAFEEVKLYLNLETEILVSSEIKKNNLLTGQDRIIEINERLNATIYINAIGGRSLYSKELFEQHNIQLYFINMKDTHYRQFHNDFVPFLSFIDVLMFNNKNETHKMLENYELN